MKKKTIHTTNAEHVRMNSEDTFSAVESNGKRLDETNRALKDLHDTVKDKNVEVLGFSGIVKNIKKTHVAIANAPKEIVNKLNEVKSAQLATNITLQKIAKKEIPVTQFPEKMKVEIEGAELVTIKGEKGDKGDKGDRGERGEKGDSVRGEKGIKGERGLKGEKGDQGKTGEKGEIGPKGKDGKDGYDAPEIDVEGVKDYLLKEVTKRLPQREDTMNQRGYSTGGANAIVIKNNGTRVTDFYTEIDFTTNITATYSNGKITVSASGGSGTSLSTFEITCDTDLNGVYPVPANTSFFMLLSNNAPFVYASNEYSGSGTTTLTLDSTKRPLPPIGTLKLLYIP